MIKSPYADLLPPTAADRYTVVLDLDETVIYARRVLPWAAFPGEGLCPHSIAIRRGDSRGREVTVPNPGQPFTLHPRQGPLEVRPYFDEFLGLLGVWWALISNMWGLISLSLFSP